jgi:hypothetical protein
VLNLKIGDGVPSCLTHSRSYNEWQDRRIASARRGKTTPIGQTVHKSGHIVCKDDSTSRSSDLVGTVAVHTDTSTYPLDVETARCSSAPESH